MVKAKWETLLRFLEVTSARCWLIVIGGRALGLLMDAENTVLPAGDTSGVTSLGHTGAERRAASDGHAPRMLQEM